MKNNLFRRILLCAAAFVFFAVAVASLAAPHQLASTMGYELVSLYAMNEFRAIYTGLWIASAIFFVIALKQFQNPLIGDLGAILILGQTLGRIISFAIDGFPGAKILPVFLMEMVAGVLILLVRPKPAESMAVRGE